ncbi:MAG TPA: acyl-CoA thioesterase domain-containing protein [Myxococcota bacterium]|nr:acyl-CoA thioesterase domain-containing protein [Myxococcota bacterium]
MSDDAWVDPSSDAFFQRPLAEILEVRPRGEGEFDAQLDGFGGVTLGCATRAAALTCPGRHAHSIHAHFLRPVSIDGPTRLRVETVREGRRFAQRRVHVHAGDKIACEMFASFTDDAPGPSFQECEPPPDVPPPDALESDAGSWRREHDEPPPTDEPLEWRWVGVPWEPAEAEPVSRYLGWVRPRFALPDEPAVHAAALAFLADYHSHIPIARRLGGPYDPRGAFTSLDQTVWIHRPRPWREWWLATSESDVAHAGRALTRRTLHAPDGRLVATMTQEMLLTLPAG